ncbi:hypothetical protein [Nocardioides nematodiphilus]|uniref:hypothetical protein n=1 Tax=Nocardioides nematodiphilus TaxID=2849669 RepID=UPI001CD945B9|nr:hypothetical protein [Nocardioides nematodiphilus]MCA1982329.1 hypothetical protein [Nocardioides nematodiphilus]
MTDPEQTLREHLARLADEVATGAPLAQRARAGRRRRLRGRLGTAAVAVLVVAGAGAVTVPRPDGSGAPPSPGGATPAARAPDGASEVRGGYRLEVWRDLGVYVPATWGWGGAPGACGVFPTRGADGHRLGEGETVPGYVGRPVAQVPRCPKPQGGRPTVPYVWLGGHVPVGTVDLGGGWVQQTRSIGGMTVTVGSPDAHLRRSILTSAAVIPTGPCSTTLASPPTADEVSTGDSSAATFVPDRMTVCAYRPTGSGYQLVYRQDLDAGAAEALVAGVDAAPPAGEFSCVDASGGEWALLHLPGEDGGSRDYVVDLSCPSITDGTGLQHLLTPEDVVPWAVDGLNAVLDGNPLIDVPGVLIGG